MEHGWSMEYRVRTYDLCKPSPMDLFSYFFSYLILFLAFPRGLLGWSSPSTHVPEPVPGVSTCSGHCRTVCVITSSYTPQIMLHIAQWQLSWSGTSWSLGIACKIMLNSTKCVPAWNVVDQIAVNRLVCTIHCWIWHSFTFQPFSILHRSNPGIR